MPKRRPRNVTRDLSYLKPKGYEKHLTLAEMGIELKKDPSWIRELEMADRLPKAKRIKHGELQIRLWSPAQVDEIRGIFSRMKVGRPRKDT